MKIVPFGEIEEKRWVLSKKYKLIENINGFWRMTEKARKNYEQDSFVNYLRGEVEKPDRLEVRSKEKEIQEILSM